MKQTTIPMKENARLIVKAGDEIMIEGSDQPVLVAIVEDGDTFRMKDEGGAIYVRTDSDAKLTIPRNTALTIEHTGGDADIMALSGNLTIQKIGGDLTFQNVNNISVDSVGGDCFFKEASGLVDIHRIGGNLDGFKAHKVKALSVGGDIELSDITGAVELKAGGDVHLHFAVQLTESSRLQAGDDIDLEVAPGTNAVLKMDSGSEEIAVHACGQELEVDERTYHLPLGEGGPEIELQAGGEIEVGEGKGSTSEFSFVFRDLGENWRDFGKEIEEKIRQSMKGVNHSLKYAGWQTSDALQKASEKMRNLDLTGDSKVFGFSFDKAEEPAAAKEKKRVSDEERMMVLKMLQDKKISVEEAEKLLQALER